MAVAADKSALEMASARTTAGGRSRRPVWPFVTALLAALALAAGWCVYALSYAPLHIGGYAGAKSRSVTLESDDRDAVRFVLHGSAGQQGQVAYLLRSDGRHAVRLWGLAPVDDNLRLAAGWTPFLTANRVAGGLPGDLRNLPVTIPPGQAVHLWLTAAKPKCGLGAGITIRSVRLHWSALGVEHRDDISLGPVADQHDIGKQTVIPIQLCGPEG